MPVTIVPHAFEPLTILDAYQLEHLPDAQYGASCHFIGTMRDFNQGDTVTKMHLSHYAGMAEKQLEAIVNSAIEQWAIYDALVIHRVGEIHPNDTIVLCAVWSAHRDASFDACRYLIEELKHKAPFWKKETLNHGERWVEP